MPIVTLPEVKAKLGSNLGDIDDELTMLIEDADSKIEQLVGPVIARPVTETVLLNRGYGLLRSVPLGDVTAVTGPTGTALTGWVVDDIGGIGGLLSSTWGLLPNGTYGHYARVTYTAGRVVGGDPVPARFKRAALRYISWSWRRDHGGSDTYTPGGDDATAGLGVAGIEKELRFILAGDLLPPRLS